MAREKKPPVAVRLRGRPQSIQGLFSFDAPAAPPGAAIRLKDPDQDDHVTLPTRVARFAPGVYEIRTKLPNTTLPGERTAELVWGDRCLEAQLVVEPDFNVDILPSGFSVQVEPGSSSEVNLGIYNKGNVTLEMTKAHVFGIMPVHIVGDSLAAAYATEAKGNDRWGALADELAARYTLARLIVRPGPTRVEPAQFQSFEVEIKWPDKMQAGARYRGLWPLGTFNVAWTIDVIDRREEEQPPRRPPK